MASHAAWNRTRPSPRRHGIMAVRRVRDGRLLHLGPNDLDIIDGDTPGRLYRDGNLVLEAGDPAIIERKRLSWNGHVAASIVLNRNGDIAAEPEVEVTGLPSRDANGLTWGSARWPPSTTPSKAFPGQGAKTARWFATLLHDRFAPK